MLYQAIIQITLAVLLVIVILLQGQGSGLGSAFGGSSSYHTKRGMEKSLYFITILLLVLFVLSSILLLV